MRKIACAIAFMAVLSLFPGGRAFGEEVMKKSIHEYRLGEIIIKGEREKPKVYFIIPKARLRLKKMSPPSDYVWEVKLIEIRK